MEVTLDRVSKLFGKVKAVDDVGFKVGDGEFVALLGPSGCGKTTTLLMIAGIYKPSAGEIRFGDRVVNALLPKDRKIGMVFQSYALYPHMTVYENIVFPLRLQRMPEKLMRERAERLADLVQIQELLDRRPGQLSGGQQQRVALSRALVKEPDILLLDEPLSNLDAKLRIAMRGEIKRLQKQLGITTIFVTHDQLEAMTMADRIALMRNGRLMDYRDPHEMYDRPRSQFTADFIGSPPINFLRARVEQADGAVSLALHRALPAAEILAADGSADMIAAAHKRLAGMPVEFRTVSFEEIIAGELSGLRFDGIFSALAIHHLAMDGKAAFFRTLRLLLNPGGHFLNVDAVTADAPEYSEWYFALWREWIEENQRTHHLEQSYGHIPDRARAKEENHYDPLGAQLAALKDAGFSDVECHYRFGIFAAYGGRNLGGAQQT